MKYLAMLLFLVGCAPSPENTKPVVDGRGTLYVFGDSISYCQQCFPSMIAVGLANVKLNNQAVPGSILESADQLQRIMAVFPQPGDKVVFLTGYNNMRGRGQTEEVLQSYRLALRAALQHLVASGQPIYVGTTMNALCDAADAIIRNGYGCEPKIGLVYSNIIKEEAGVAGAHVVDVNAQWQPTRKNLYDLVHPTPAGSAELARMFLEIMN